MVKIFTEKQTNVIEQKVKNAHSLGPEVVKFSGFDEFKITKEKIINYIKALKNQIKQKNK